MVRAIPHGEIRDQHGQLASVAGREILTCADRTPTTPEEVAGEAILAPQAGRIDQIELHSRMKEIMALPSSGTAFDPS